MKNQRIPKFQYYTRKDPSFDSVYKNLFWLHVFVKDTFKLIETQIMIFYVLLYIGVWGRCNGSWVQYAILSITSLIIFLFLNIWELKLRRIFVVVLRYVCWLAGLGGGAHNAHISDCIIIITSLPSLPGPGLLSVGPHAGPGETLDHPDCDGSYLSWDEPTTAKLQSAWPQSRPMGAQCHKMSWLHLNFLLSIKIYT